MIKSISSLILASSLCTNLVLAEEQGNASIAVAIKSVTHEPLSLATTPTTAIETVPQTNKITEFKPKSIIDSSNKRVPPKFTMNNIINYKHRFS